MAHRRQRSAERLIDAEPGAIFDVLTDVQQHHLFDGSSMLQGSPKGPYRLTLGSGFSMAMKQRGVGYRSLNRVIEFEPDRLIAWKTTGEVFGFTFIGGQIWRYELTPQGSATLVRETYDLSQAKASWALDRLGYPERMQEAMEQTLQRLDALMQQKSAG